MLSYVHIPRTCLTIDLLSIFSVRQHR
jgi:hypothetical protein